MSNEPTGLNFVKKYFETFILCATCQKDDVAEPEKQTELTDNQINMDASNIISSTFDIAVYLEENKPIQNKDVELTTNPNNWTIYNAFKNKTNYILTKKNDKSIIYKADLKNENGKMLFTVNDKNNKYIGTRVSTGIHPLSTFGKFENTVINIDYKKGNKRININIGNNETLITGYGGFSNSITHSAPWDTVIPIVYTDGGTCIGLMDYVENKNIKSSTYLPFEIIVSNKNEKYLPIFFTVYVMVQEYIEY